MQIKFSPPKQPGTPIPLPMSNIGNPLAIFRVTRFEIYPSNLDCAREGQCIIFLYGQEFGEERFIAAMGFCDSFLCSCEINPKEFPYIQLLYASAMYCPIIVLLTQIMTTGGQFLIVIQNGIASYQFFS